VLAGGSLLDRRNLACAAVITVGVLPNKRLKLTARVD